MKRIGACGELPRSITVRDLRVERRGYLKTFSVQVDGIPHRIEFTDRGSSVAVLPIDFVRREIYLIRTPRPAQAFARSGTAVNKIRTALDEGSDPSENVVPGDEINLWEVPAGMIEPEDETELTSAMRELLEEIDLDLTADRFIPLGPATLSAGGSTELTYLFVCSICEQLEHVAPKGDGTERIEVWRVSFDEMRELIRSNTIVTATTRILILSVLLWLSEGDRSPIPPLPSRE